MPINHKIIAAVLPLVFVGCAGLKRRSEIVTHPRAEGAIPAPQAHPSEGVAKAPAPVVAPPKVGLILGPGGFKAFAHAGILKEFARARIPVNRIIGLEWGALVAGLYAQKGQVHEVEWKLYKLEQRDLPGRGFLSNEIKAAPIKSLDGFLQDSFSQGSMGGAAVPFACPSLSVTGGVVQWQERGEWAEALRRCMAYPPLYSPQESWVSAPFIVAEAVEKLKREGAQLIIMVNVLGGGELFSRGQLPENAPSAILWLELRRALRAAQPLVGEWIEIDTSKFDLMAFDKRRDLVRAGELAGQQVVPKLVEKYGF